MIFPGYAHVLFRPPRVRSSQHEKSTPCDCSIEIISLSLSLFVPLAALLLALRVSSRLVSSRLALLSSCARCQLLQRFNTRYKLCITHTSYCEKYKRKSGDTSKKQSWADREAALLKVVARDVGRSPVRVKLRECCSGRSRRVAEFAHSLRHHMASAKALHDIVGQDIVVLNSALPLVRGVRQ